MMTLTAVLLTAVVGLFLLPRLHELGIPYSIAMIVAGVIVLGGVLLAFNFLNRKER